VRRRSSPYRLLTRALMAAAVSAGAQPLAAQPSPDMSFFLALVGPARGADRPVLEVSDEHCAQLAYTQGFGHLKWRAYLDGPGERARDRIGSGPWYNYHGVPIAESVAQLHSDDNNLWHESAVTVTGETAPPGAIELPWGSELDGSDFTRAGPFLCFGAPQ
jgi:hypothetical protein